MAKQAEAPLPQTENATAAKDEAGTIVKDVELKAMFQIVKAIESLPKETRGRVSRYLADRLGLQPNPG